MKILAIDTSCDETAVAVSEGTKILSNTIWSQASLHAKFGGVFPSLAKREHEKRIDWVIKKSLVDSHSSLVKDIDAIAVTVGPGLAVALEVGIRKAKELAIKYKKPLIAVNHIEGHLLSSLATPRTEIYNFQFQISKEKQKNKSQRPTAKDKRLARFPALGIVASGGNTQIIYIDEIGKYKVLASTTDDAVGEALDKAARMLGLGYPGGPILEKLAHVANPKKKKEYILPVPLLGQEKRMIFSYSGLKTALYRKIEELKNSKVELTKEDIENFAYSFQKTAFIHLIRVFEWIIENENVGEIKGILAGGGVMANVFLRKMLRGSAQKYGIAVHFPYSKRLYGDNAAMIGVAAHFKAERGEFEKNLERVDRIARLSL